MADTTTLLESINKLILELPKGDQACRDKLLYDIDCLRLAIETPMETAFRIGYQPWQHSAVRLAIELGIFDILAESASDRMSLKALSSKASLDNVLLTRILRMLVALGLCSGNPTDGYIANSKTAIFTVPQGRDSFKIWADVGAPTANGLTKYFKSHGPVNPEDSTDSPFASVAGDEFWSWKSKHPEVSSTFDSFMASRRIGRPYWFDLYPIKDCVESDADSHGVAIVDVGGGRGHDLTELRSRMPELEGRLVLQDLPEVVSQINKPLEGIKVMPHSFFETQPVKGAKVYLFRAVFHDWPTESCEEILKRIADAMTPGYSKLLISDFVLDDNKPDVFSASIDLQMMGLHTGMERSEAQWRTLLETAGLEISGIWQKSKLGESVIEAQLIDSTFSPTQVTKKVNGDTVAENAVDLGQVAGDDALSHKL